LGPDTKSFGSFGDIKMIDLTPTQRRRMLDSRAKFVAYLDLVIQLCGAELMQIARQDPDDPPADREGLFLRLEYALRAETLTAWRVSVPDEWLTVIYNRPAEPVE